MSETITTQVLPEAKFKIFTGLLKAFESETDGTPRLSGIASSTTRDHHGDVMEESALRDMEAAANGNMTIFLNHSYDVPEDVAGSVERAAVTQRGYDGDGNPNWDLDMEIAINRENDRAVKAWSAIKNGTKLGLSIGAMIPKGGATRDKDTGALTISRLLLMETSIVSIPANPRSWISNAVKALNTASDEQDSYITSHAGTFGYVPTTTTNVTTSTWTVATQPEVEEDVDPEIQRPTCPECGGHRNSPKGGCSSGFHSKDIDPPASQGASESEPENEDGAVQTSVTENADPDIDLDPVMQKGVEAVLVLLESTTAKLDDARTQLDVEKRAREAAEAQRDEAVTTANEVFAQARAIFDRLAETPMGRKTSFVRQQDDFDHLDGIYSEKFRRLLNHGGNRHE